MGSYVAVATSSLFVYKKTLVWSNLIMDVVWGKFLCYESVNMG